MLSLSCVTCIRFHDILTSWCVQKATVTVQSDGLSFNVEVGQTVLSRAHLHYQTNFRSYAYDPPAHIIKEYKKMNESRKSKRRQDRDSSATEEDEDDDEEHANHGKGHRGAQAVQDDVDSTPPPMTFEISLSALLNCLNIFGDTTVKPISARAQANRERWKQRQQQQNGNNAGGNGGPQYGRRSSRYGNDDDNDDDEDEESDGPQLRDEALFQRDSARAGSTVSAGRKKANVAMVLTWQEEGCPLVLL